MRLQRSAQPNLRTGQHRDVPVGRLYKDRLHRPEQDSTETSRWDVSTKTGYIVLSRQHRDVQVGRL